MLQAAYRVGRGADKARRVVAEDTQLVDHMAQIRYKNKLLLFIDPIKKKRKNKNGSAANGTSASAPP